MVLTRVYVGQRVVNNGLPTSKTVTHVHFTNKATVPHRGLISVVDPQTSQQTVREDAIFIEFHHSWCKVVIATSYEFVQCRRSQLEILDESNPEHRRIMKFPRPCTKEQVDATFKHTEGWLGFGVSACETSCSKSCDILCLLVTIAYDSKQNKNNILILRLLCLGVGGLN